jgi:hypothetical protein
MVIIQTGYGGSNPSCQTFPKTMTHVKLERIKDIVSKYNVPFKERLAKRFYNLAKWRAEEEKSTGDFSFNVCSMHALLNFIATKYSAKYPDIGLDADGHLVAQWRTSAEHDLVIMFYGMNDLKYVFMVPGKKAIYGNDTPDGMWEKIRAYGDPEKLI